MIYLLLAYEFFKIGLFAVGGGLAVLPFLTELANRYDWLAVESLSDMIAISESTPGPIGVNMAVYAGFNAGGILGAVIATVALVIPAMVIIMVISKFLDTFKDSVLVQSTFCGLRPAVCALITSAFWGVCKVTLVDINLFHETKKLLSLVNFPAVGLFAVMFVLIKKFDWHPISYIVAAGVVGMIFKF